MLALENKIHTASTTGLKQKAYESFTVAIITVSLLSFLIIRDALHATSGSPLSEPTREMLYTGS